MRAYAFREVQVPRGLWVGLFMSSFVALPIARHVDPQHAVLVHLAVWSGFAMLVLLVGRLCIEVDSDEIRWSFGWFGWPGGRVRLSDIRQVEPAGMNWREGWGVRRTPEGMLYNLCGRQTVRIRCRDGRQWRLGSQDPGALINAISPRLQPAGRPT
jgi:hypothetical protein